MAKLKDLIIKYINHQKKFWRDEVAQSHLHRKLNVNVKTLYDQVHQSAEPLFVLSTGRSGTKLLSDIIALDPKCIVAHQPSPELTHSAWYAYQNHGEKFNELCQIIDACRYEIIRDTWILGKKYIETNNRITFFAPYLADLFPKAKFIHLKRDPYQFITSGYSRNWYAYEKLFDEGKITPRKKDQIPWDRYTQVQKIAWLWKETNGFIDQFMTSLPSQRKLFLESDELYSSVEKIANLLSFAGINTISPKQIRSKISTPVNAQPNKSRKPLNTQQRDEIDQILNS
ncbi:MAG: sulfotransferase [Saprospiraceae bacterium]|nr:sulfotransferase [Saprospiraceae bacterium]